MNMDTTGKDIIIRTADNSICNQTEFYTCYCEKYIYCCTKMVNRYNNNNIRLKYYKGGNSPIESAIQSRYSDISVKTV